MIDLPETQGVPVIRTDLGSDLTWEQVRAELAAPDDDSGYVPNLEFVERADLAALDADALAAQVPRTYPSAYEHPFLVVVDDICLSSAEHPVLLIDLAEDETAPWFRALPRQVAAIEANLSIANMDFYEFGDNVDDDGVFRGFG